MQNSTDKVVELIPLDAYEHTETGVRYAYNLKEMEDFRGSPAYAPIPWRVPAGMVFTNEEWMRVFMLTRDQREHLCVAASLQEFFTAYNLDLTVEARMHEAGYNGSTDLEVWKKFTGRL